MVGWHSYISTRAADACSALIGLQHTRCTNTPLVYLSFRQHSRGVLFWVSLSAFLFKPDESPFLQIALHTFVGDGVDTPDEKRAFC